MRNQEFANDNEEVVEQPEVQEESPTPEEPQAEAPQDDEDDNSGNTQEEPNYDPIKARFNKMQREKYNLINRVNELETQLNRSEQLTNISTQAAMKHYSESAYDRLERAKNMQSNAIETGDVRLQTDAIAEIAAATAKIQDMEKWQTEQEFIHQQQAQQNQYNEDPAVTYQRQAEYEATRWTQSNPHLNPESPQYNRQLGVAIDLYADKLANYLRQNGEANQIYSRQFFDEIDNQAALLSNQYQGNRGLNMRQGNNAVSRVTHGGGPGRRSVNEQLSPLEQELARNFNLTDKEYVKYRMQINAQDKRKNSY